MSNYSNGDRVVALVDFPKGVQSGMSGRVTSVSFAHGLLSVRFDNGAEIPAVRLHQVKRA